MCCEPHSRTRAIELLGPSTDDYLDAAKANIDVRALRASKVCLKMCIVALNFPHGEVLSRSRAVTNAAIHISRSGLISPATLKGRPAYFTPPLSPPACVSVPTLQLWFV